MLERVKGEYGFHNDADMVYRTAGILRKNLRKRPPSILKVEISEK